MNIQSQHWSDMMTSTFQWSQQQFKNEQWHLLLRDIVGRGSYAPRYVTTKAAASTQQQWQHRALSYTTLMARR